MCCHQRESKIVFHTLEKRKRISLIGIKSRHSCLPLFMEHNISTIVNLDFIEAKIYVQRNLTKFQIF